MVKDEEYITLPQLAKMLGISRIAVFKKVKSGEIKAIKIGRNYAVKQDQVLSLLGKALGEKDKLEIDKAVKKTVKEYGEVLKKLGKE